MANTAIARFRVEYYGSSGWVIWLSNGSMLTCATKTQLLSVLQGQYEKAIPPEKAKLAFESVEDFLARGGKIQRIGRLKPPKPLSLADLGLADPEEVLEELAGIDTKVASQPESETPRKSPEPGVPVFSSNFMFNLLD